MVLVGFSPAIGVLIGGEAGGDGVRTCKIGNVPLGKKVVELVGKEASPTTTLIGEGIVKPGVGKSPKVLGLSQGTTSGETGVSKFSPSKPRPGEEKTTGKPPKFKAIETPTEDIIGV
jgi:hypothetical protein